jgi:peptide/nickel transport system substrate-binding protein
MTYAKRLTGLALALAVAGAAGAAQAETSVKVSLNADIRSTYPGVNRDANTDGVVHHIVEGLVAFKENSEVAPLLAEKIDLSADGLPIAPSPRRSGQSCPAGPCGPCRKSASNRKGHG